MILDYLPIFIIVSVAVLIAIFFVNASWFFGPRNPNKEKLSTYESGMEPIGSAHERFSVKYYMVAVSFIVFDIEIVFLYPWAVSFIHLPKNELMFSLTIGLIFILILIIGLIYEFGKDVLKWD